MGNVKQDFDFEQKGLAGFYDFLEKYPSESGLIITNRIQAERKKFRLTALKDFLINK